MFPGNVGRALSMFDKNDDGLLDFREFVEINGQFPLMLFPAFRLQDNIQAMSLGRVEWVRMLRRLRWADHVANYQASHNGRKPKMGFGQFYNDKILLPDTLGALTGLTELWAHSNKLTTLPSAQTRSPGHSNCSPSRSTSRRRST
jgi:hypothetical protein